MREYPSVSFLLRMFNTEEGLRTPCQVIVESFISSAEKRPSPAGNISTKPLERVPVSIHPMKATSDMRRFKWIHSETDFLTSSILLSSSGPL